jgi:hypothetical protein
MKTFNLENEPKIKSGFEIPENYFETFSDKLMAKLPNKEVKVISIYQKRKKWIFAAAAILVLSVSIPILYQFSMNKFIDEGTLENYITNQSTLSENDIVDLLNDDAIQKMNLDLKIDNKSIENELLKTEISEQELLN